MSNAGSATSFSHSFRRLAICRPISRMTATKTSSASYRLAEAFVNEEIRSAVLVEEYSKSVDSAAGLIEHELNMSLDLSDVKDRDMLRREVDSEKPPSDPDQDNAGTDDDFIDQATAISILLPQARVICRGSDC